MKILNDKITQQSKYMEIHSTEYEDQKGNIKEWSWVSRPNGVKAVMIVAQVNGEYKWNVGRGYQQNNKLAVIKEYRVPLNNYEWGFPAGLIDGDEPVEQSIRRELKEETGLDLIDIICLSPFVYSTAGITDEAIAIAYVRAEGNISSDNLESSEDIETYLMDQDQIYNLINTNPARVKFGAKAWIILNNFAHTGRIV